MSAQKSKQRRGLDEDKYSEKIMTHSLIHSIFFLAALNNHSHPHQNKNTRGASLQHRHLALEVARDHRQPIRSQEVVGATGEKMLLHPESQPHGKSQTAFWKANGSRSSWIIQGNLTLTSIGKTQLNFRGALLQVAAKPPPVRDFFSSKVSTTALYQPQTVATKRFCSPLRCHQPHTCCLLDQGSARSTPMFLLTHQFSAGVGSLTWEKGPECWDIPRKALCLPPSGIPVC